MGQVMDLVAHQTEALWSPSSGYNKLFVPRDEVFNFAFFSGLPAWTMSGTRHVRRGLLRVAAT